MTKTGRNSWRRLSSRIGLGLAYRDQTRLGSVISGQCERRLQTRFAVFHAYRDKYGLAELVRSSRKVLARTLPRCLDGILTPSGELDPGWLYPDPALVRPAMLRVQRDLNSIVARIPLDDDLVPGLAAYLGDWQLGSVPPRSGPARALWDALVEAGALVTSPAPAPRERRCGVEFIGHATLGFDDGAQRLLADPYWFPRSSVYPGDWQPLRFSDLARPDAVLITHSHPDHFDLGTLLRLGVDTPIHVPAVERESVLAVDVAARLEELGFRSVHRVEHFDEFGVGEMRVVGLPFFGEQPTVGERRHLEIRNQGLTWLVEMAGRRFFVIADAGRDADGDVRDLAAEVRARYGAVDTAFGSYRGFALYPVQYVFSTVSRYLPFVPAESWGERQQIMCDPDDLIDVAERCSARRLVPYAGGGAPWYWLRGLGPCLDGAGESRTWSEPPPEQVVRAAARRSGTSNVGAVPSPVEVLPLHVGDGLWF